MSVSQSLINCILKSDRTIVSEIPGTTRDSVDVPFTLNEKPYVLIDTAGLRHRRKIKNLRGSIRFDARGTQHP